MPQSSKSQPAPRDWQRFARLGFSAFILLCILGGLVFGVVAGCTLDVGKLEQQKLSTVVYGANDKVVTVLFQENRDYITLDMVPQSIKDAFIATEDTKFYEHRGIDVMGIGRALLADLRLGSLSQGASTITQQLVRQTYLSNEKSVARKVREAIYAVVIERYYTKDQIFEKYLNKVYFGRSAYGVQAASLSYFGKNAADLNLSEAALIAGLVQAPSTYMNNPAKAQARRNDVLDRMVTVGFITANEGALAKRQPVQFVERSTSRNTAPYFLDYIVQELVRHGIDQTEIYTGGLQIKTTLDVDAQKAAEAAFANGLPAASPDASGVSQPQAAMIAIDPHTGYIKAMIGGRDFGNTQLNRAVMAYRQPGSTMKPFVYTAAIDNQFTPSSVLTDEPISYRTGGKPWAPQNYDHTFRGPITLREALENSVNVIAVKLVDQIGVQTVMKYAQRMGLSSLITTGARNDMNLSSLALGGLTRGVTPLELATAYTPLANRGVRVEPVAVLEVRDRTGAVLYRNHTRQTAVLSESTAYMMTDMMRGVIERGTGRGANIGRPAAGKTGTTSDNTNAWFVGYTPDLLSVVWLGNDSQRKPLIVNGSLIGSGTAARIWGRFMSAALAKTPASDFRTNSANLVTVDVCADSGYLATPDCPNIRSETFVSGTQPAENCPLHSPEGKDRYEAVQVCLLSGKLATKNCPENQVVTRYYDRTTAKEIHGGDSTLPQEYCDLHNQQEVTVKVCTESGLLATPYCPADSVITQTFIEGEEPTQPCNIHHP